MEKETDIKLLVAKVLLFASPALFLIVMSVLVDPFRIYHEYQDYQKGNVVFLNREFVCLKLYQRNAPKIAYDSFILGNSRSQAFKVRNWELYLPPGARGFHFDSAGGGLYGIHNRIRYIDQSGGKLAHVLLVLDQHSLTATKNLSGHLFISPPDLSHESSYEFYSEFSKPLLNLKFVIGYIDYSINGIHRDYMSQFFSNVRYPDVTDAQTNDVYYGVDKLIFEDRDRYYRDQMAKGVFYDRAERIAIRKGATREEALLLRKVKWYFDKHGTDYRIVISPMYDQLPLGEDHLRLLLTIFDPSRVHNYSGRNRLTEPVANFYENSHFRPHVADLIMRDIYLRPPPPPGREAVRSGDFAVDFRRTIH